VFELGECLGQQRIHSLFFEVTPFFLAGLATSGRLNGFDLCADQLVDLAGWN
jgi:hypothetical protein